MKSMLSTRSLVVLFVCACWLTAPPWSPAAQAPPSISGKKPPVARAQQQAARRRAEREKRVKALHALCELLEIGPGCSVADVGAGNGQDTWVFAEIVGPDGKVYAEEISKDKVESIKKQAAERGLSHVEAILGKEDDPRLPTASVDMAYMHYVYHHFNKPREMLRGLWRGIKPGGFLVIVDRRRGTLRDWVPREVRAKRHYWIAETTVVREAREEGFLFFRCAEECWPGEDQFVLVFQRPPRIEKACGDPDPFLPLPLEEVQQQLLPLARPYRRPVFVALGEARALIAPVLKHSATPGVDIVLEEWATQKDERPPLPEGVQLPSVLTESGDPRLGPEPVDVVFFLDSYHLLFHHRTLLAKLHEAMAPSGCIYVLDRKADEELPRREASHRRKIHPKTVRQEMAEAGFSFWFQGPAPAADRFLLVFGKLPPEELAIDRDPCVAGPDIPDKPERWLAKNAWRLRGFRAADGTAVAFSNRGHRANIEPRQIEGSPGTWLVPQWQVELVFDRIPTACRLSHCRFVEFSAAASGHSQR